MSHKHKQDTHKGISSKL